ncbi:MAG: hypothetical protein AB3N20_08785 [Rhizobiaceae bacterium]
MNRFRRLTVGAFGTAIVLAGMSFMPANAVTENTIGDNVTANTGVGFVLMVSIRRSQ